MRVFIRSFAMIREIMGSKSLELETSSSNLEEILMELISTHPSLKKYLFAGDKWDDNFIYAVNGNRIPITQLSEVSINENDEIAIIPPAGGG